MPYDIIKTYVKSGQIRAAIILNPTLTPDDFLECVMLEFGIFDIPANKLQRLSMLHEFLLKVRQDGKVSLLIVDEAHRMSTEVLEEIRMLRHAGCKREILSERCRRARS